MVLANGEDEALDEAASAEHDRRMGEECDGFNVALGGHHGDDCPNMSDGEWIGATDCDCETRDFSWAPCDTCGSILGGSRYAVTFFDKEG